MLVYSYYGAVGGFNARLIELLVNELRYLELVDRSSEVWPLRTRRLPIRCDLERWRPLSETLTVGRPSVA